MKRIKSLFWGILLIAGAVFLIAGGMGYFENFGFWTLFSMIVLGGVVLDGLTHRNIGKVMFGVAVFCIVNRKWLGLEELSVWTIIFAAMLISVGLKMLFPAFFKKKNHIFHDKRLPDGLNEYENMNVENHAGGEKIYYGVNFGDGVKYIDSSGLKRLKTECSFGCMKVYFENTGLKEGEARAEVDCSFGTTMYYIPADWNVIVDIDCSFGGCQEFGNCNPYGDNTLHIIGDVSFGSLEIHYI